MKPCPDQNNCPLFRPEEPCHPQEIERCIEFGIRHQITEIIEEYEEETGHNRKDYLADKMDRWRGFCTGY